MNYLRTLFLALSPALLVASAESNSEWPNQFNLVCGDHSTKIGDDGADDGVITAPAIRGQATQIPSSEITGYWEGGVGYRIPVNIIDQSLMGTYQPRRTVLHCYFKGVDPTDDLGALQAQMSCTSTLDTLPSVPGFNMLTASIGVPARSIFSNAGQFTRGELRVRSSQRLVVQDRSANRYYTTSRELTCKYSQP
jgi:hypothetical protein